MLLEKLKEFFTKRPKAHDVNYDSLPPIDFRKYDSSFPKKPVVSNEKLFLIQSPQETVLNIPYNTQRDNRLSPTSACNVTSLAMSISPYYTKEHEDLLITKFGMANFHTKIYDQVAKLGYHNLSLDDKLFAAINSREFQNYMLHKYPREVWIQNYFHKCAGNEVFLSLVEIVNYILNDTRYATMNKRLSLDLIIKEIQQGYPVIICGKFTGGHFVLVVGYNLKKNVLVIHDPWGNWNTGYKDVNGKFVEYSIPKLFAPNFLASIPILVHFDRRVRV